MPRRAYGTGSIQYVPSRGRWMAVIPLPYKRGEPRRRKTLLASTREAAEARLAEYMAQHPAPEYPGRAVHLDRAREVGSHTEAEWWALVRREKGLCFYCGVKTDLTWLPTNHPRHLHRDHKTPLSRGGSDGIDNIAV